MYVAVSLPLPAPALRWQYINQDYSITFQMYEYICESYLSLPDLLKVTFVVTPDYYLCENYNIMFVILQTVQLNKHNFWLFTSFDFFTVFYFLRAFPFFPVFPL